MALIDVIVYGTFSVGYLLILLLTERAAGRFVRGETLVPPDHTIRIRIDAAGSGSACRTVFTAPAALSPRRRSAA
ncbi:MAG: hypothetical protein U1E22_09075 [Coriobacteriia bacterium]|nr:hypothetical protein [Coriobacteriia bacterium]